MNTLGIDYGERQVGVALSSGMLTEGIAEYATGEAVVRIAALCKKYEVARIVVGISQGRLKEKIEQFGENLSKISQIPVIYFDETLTTQVAQNLLITSNLSAKKRKKKEHRTAAAILLQNYIDTYV